MLIHIICDFSLSSGGTRCRIDQFTCRNGDCVEGDQRCNGAYECPDGSDELECRMLSSSSYI